jgi:hypothetical protein
MASEQTGEEHTTEEQTAEQAWREVGRQFQVLGESLATAFRTAWESEENRQHLESVRTGLEAMVNDISQAAQEVGASPEGQRVREEMERAAESARVAGERALQDARPHLLSALQWINAEMRKVIDRLDQQDPEI